MIETADRNTGHMQLWQSLTAGFNDNVEAGYSFKESHTSVHV